jgi:hypothetical protein
MEQLARLKESVFGYFSPGRTQTTMSDTKRRRTIGPGTPSKDLAGEHAYEPFSEPRGEKAQVALYHRLSTKYVSTSHTRNPLKRGRGDEDEDEQLNEREDVEMAFNSEDGDSISPEDSPSQITSNYDDGDEEGEDDERGRDEDGDQGEEEDYEANEVEQAVDADAAAREKVEEYLARQAELALKKDAIAQVKAQGDWHPDEVFLFERLSLRSFEPIVPREWQIDFRTLPEDLFEEDKNRALINFNHRSSIAGK